MKVNDLLDLSKWHFEQYQEADDQDIKSFHLKACNLVLEGLNAKTKLRNVIEAVMAKEAN